MEPENRNKSNLAEHRDDTLNLDLVLSTQPELGPSIPDGGYGWFVVGASLFYYATLPCLILSFGIFLACLKLRDSPEVEDGSMHRMWLWDNKFISVPLFFTISQLVADSSVRTLVSKTSWPQLVSTSGTCLTCAGLIFTWMGVSRVGEAWLYIPAGILIGVGTSLVLAQCDILLSQYFRVKLGAIQLLCRCVAACGFFICPMILGKSIILSNFNIPHVLLWYQAVILQGLIASLFLKKPKYLKSRNVNAARPSYLFVAGEADEEEDIFSKNSRELQSRRQDICATPGTSSEPKLPENKDKDTNNKQEWVRFEDELADDEDEESDEESKSKNYGKSGEWERFDDDDRNTVPNKSLEQELKTENTFKYQPQSLFSSSQSSVNNNHSYSYEDDLGLSRGGFSSVFQPNQESGGVFGTQQVRALFADPVFYKSLLMISTNKLSSFIFYSLFPTYLFLQVKTMSLRNLPTIMGAICLVLVFFQVVSPLVNLSQKNRPLLLWLFCWVGTGGYFMISDFQTEPVMIAGAAQVLVSLSVLQHVSKPLYPISIKGEMSREYRVIMFLSGLLLLVFYLLDADFRDLFRAMAILHFFVGVLWLSNYIYKRLRVS